MTVTAPEHEAPPRERERFSLTLGITLAVQVLGPLSSILIVLMIARRGGPTLQGVFVSYKSLSDLLLSVGLFGLPQAFIYLINKKSLAERAASAFIIFYSGVVLVVSALVVWSQFLTHYLPLPLRLNVITCVTVLALGSAGYVIHGLTRSLVLTRTDGAFFSIFTVAPNIALLTWIVVEMSFETPDFAAPIGSIGFLSGLGAIAWLWLVAKPDLTELKSIPYREVAHQSVQMFLQSTLYSGQPLATIALLRIFGASLAGVGSFSLATVTMNAINVAVSLIAPILFNRWTKILSHRGAAQLVRRTLALSGLAMVAAVAGLFLAPLSIRFFGQSYAASLLGIRVLLMTAFPLLFTRVMSPAIHALGHPVINTWSCVGRLVTACVALICLQAIVKNLMLAAALSWLIAEWIAMAIQWGLFHRLLREHLSDKSVSAA